LAEVENQGNAFRSDKFTPNDEGVRQPARMTLRSESEFETEFRAVTEKPLKKRKVQRR
jgi:hypothetical protein